MRKNILVIGFLLVSIGLISSRIAETNLVEAVAKAKLSPILSPTVVVDPTTVPVKTGVAGKEEAANYRLESVLEKQKLGKWNGINTVRKMVRVAVERGVPANTIVLLLLLPLIATLVSMLHYIFGLSGYGLFMPTMIAVTFLVTGILGGLVLFALILVISTLSGLMLKKLRLHFWPSRAINLVLISSGTFGLMVVSSYTGVLDMTKISIFPMLLMILLVEEFVRTQLIKSRNEAVKLTVGTLILAIMGSIMMNFRWIQEVVLLNPEITIVLVLVVNLLVGNYSGMRLAELQRFKKAIRSTGKKQVTRSK